MKWMIDAPIAYARTMITLLICLFLGGIYTYITIPKDSDPDITIPIIYVSVSYEGISPDDAERLLVRPIEHELRSIEGVKEMTAVAGESHASVTLEFSAGVDLDEAMSDVREAMDMVKPNLPDGAEEPTVNEVTFANMMPVLSVVLYGDVSERAVVKIARKLRDELEGFKQIMEVDIAGDRDEIVEIIVEPLLLETYGLDQEAIFNLVSRNNRVVAAGNLDTGVGRFSIKVPSVFETTQDVMNLPVKIDGDEVITVADVATLRSGFKDPESFARLDGKPAVVLDVKKRTGENIIETVELVKAVMDQAQKMPDWPAALQVKYTRDGSETVRTMLTDLQNNILSAILLVVIVCIAVLGARSALLVGISIPGSFLTGLLVLGMAGFTINIVVLFALIMAVGLLVDGAIVVTEYADRRMREGVDRKQAYRESAHRMTWPIIASTATTLAAFAPLMFWPDITGEFMKFMPFTLIATLSASLLMALVFIPVLGSLLGKPSPLTEVQKHRVQALEHNEFDKVDGFTGRYIHLLAVAIRHPIKILCGAIVLSGSVFYAYSQFGLGTEFFPDVDPDSLNIKVRAYGDLSIYEQDELMRDVEMRVMGMDEIASVYTKTGGKDDEIGVIQLKPIEWQYRRKVSEIVIELRERVKDVVGVELEFKSPQAGPPSDQDLLIEITSINNDELVPAAEKIQALLRSNPAFTNLNDTLPRAGIDISIDIDRANAARFGADATLVGNTVQFVTNGLKIGDYLPDGSDDDVDILVRFPKEKRDIGQFEFLRVYTEYGLVPITNFAQIRFEPKQNNIDRVDGKRVIKLMADMTEGYNLSLALPRLKSAIDTLNLPSTIEINLGGQNEEQGGSETFLMAAFGAALAVMALILITQFNSFYQAFLILSAVLFSTVGVFLGLLILQRPFGVIMSGVGVITLAGIVVNNNIVLIDTYNVLRKEGMEKVTAILQTGAQRLRPVLLTTITTILGLLPMVLEMNVDLVNRGVEFGAPSTQWWSQLATTVAGGLAFSTLLTLILTPCLLMLGRDRYSS